MKEVAVGIEQAVARQGPIGVTRKEQDRKIRPAAAHVGGGIARNARETLIDEDDTQRVCATDVLPRVCVKPALLYVPARKFARELKV